MRGSNPRVFIKLFLTSKIDLVVFSFGVHRCYIPVRLEYQATVPLSLRGIYQRTRGLSFCIINLTLGYLGL